MDEVITEVPNLSYDSSVNTTSWLTRIIYIMIFLILIFLGFNIFTYLGSNKPKQNYKESKKGGIDMLEKAISNKKKKSKSIIKALDTASTHIPLPDDAGSKTQASKSRGKSGYCYIGEDRGFRTCIEVGEADKCMSGDIFPSQDICINPSLRE
jgi:hypothetical protein